MDRLAIVIQRYSGVTGGSEALARYYAETLRSHFKVDVLTTTAGNLDTWAEQFSPGSVEESGCNVMRFNVTIGRSNYWHALNALLMRQHSQKTGFVPWSTALQEEWIRRQGPHSESLLEYLRLNHQNYQCVLFFTYMYSHSYFGTMRVPRVRSRLIPTLHDEPAAYLEAFAESARRTGGILWNTESEKSFGEGLWGHPGGQVIGMGIDVAGDGRRDSTVAPYILYSGRIDPGKGCNELFEMFAGFRKKHPTLKLKLTGQLYAKIPSGNGIEYLGFVANDRKLDLMRNAVCFCMPSINESLSIATLEAMSVRTPVLVNGKNPVLLEHVERSQGGIQYTDAAQFEEGVQACLQNARLRDTLGENGRQYVLKHYAHSAVRDRLLHAVSAKLSA
ncbi:MAG: glycosyltransferase family 4 protein [Leptospirales bacterium]|nr:glycosyltransferase family 4 protein [Leptospirales bacterium]